MIYPAKRAKAIVLDCALIPVPVGSVVGLPIGLIPG